MCRADKSQASANTCIVRNKLRYYIGGSGEGVLSGFNSLFGVNIFFRKPFGRRRIRKLLQDFFRERFKSLFLCDRRSRFALFLIRSVKVIQLGQRCGVVYRGGKLVRKRALFFYCGEYLLPCFVERAQISEPFGKRAQKLVVQASGHFLSVSGDERNGVAAVQQLNGFFNLSAAKTEFFC